MGSAALSVVTVMVPARELAKGQRWEVEAQALDLVDEPEDATAAIAYRTASRVVCER